MRAAAFSLMLLLCAGCLAPAPDPGDGAGTSTAPASSGLGRSTSPGSDPTPQHPPPEPDTLFVTLSRDFRYEQVSGDRPPSFYRGHHCSDGRWSRDPLTVTVNKWASDPRDTVTPDPQADPWEPSGLLFTIWDRARDAQNVSSLGYGPRVAGFDIGDDRLPLPRAFGEGVVANLTAEDGSVRVDGHPLELEVSHVVHAVYRHTEHHDPPNEYDVVEELEFTLHGLARVYAGPTSYCA